MKLNRKLWTAALAVAMTTPSAMAAQDTAGMHYTSAAEGFYASIRARYVSNGGKKDGGSDIQNSSSRFGVRGTNDLGSGLEGFYQYEAGVGIDNGSGLSTRLGHVGLRGDFGSVVAGSFWPETYNWVYGSTDVANRHSGNSTGGFGQYRASKSLQYTTPDLNGFQGAFLIKMDPGSDGEGSLSGPTGPTDHLVLSVLDVTATSTVNVSTSRVEVDDESGEEYHAYYENREDRGGGVTRISTIESERVSPGNPGNPKDDNDIDHWSLAAKYEIAGFSMGLSYANNPDGGKGYASDLNSSMDALGSSIDTFVAGTVTYKNVSVKREGKGYTSTGDLPSWAFKLGYSQDNWYVNSWYGVIGVDAATGTMPVRASSGAVVGTVSVSPSDTEVFSIAGGISVDKVKVYAVYENREYDQLKDSDGAVAFKRVDDSRSTLGVQYTLGSNSWTWVEYAGRDLGSDKNADDDFSIGLGHSF